MGILYPKRRCSYAMLLFLSIFSPRTSWMYFGSFLYLIQFELLMCLRLLDASCYLFSVMIVNLWCDLWSLSLSTSFIVGLKLLWIFVLNLKNELQWFLIFFFFWQRILLNKLNNVYKGNCWMNHQLREKMKHQLQCKI